jgi:anti-sigma factor RsiW
MSRRTTSPLASAHPPRGADRGADVTARSDLPVMEHADGELADAELAARIERDPDARAKVQAIKQIGELVRGHLELSADAVHDAKFAAMWQRIDDQLVAPATGVWSRISGWFDRYRGHVITGAVSAGAVAALALVLRPSAQDVALRGRSGGPIIVRDVALRASPEIDSLDTPGGSSTVINLDDEDGHTTVIWVTPADTVEGI